MPVRDAQYYANKRYRERHRKEIARRQRERRRKNPDKYKCAVLRCLYNLSLDEYNQKLKEQGGVCAICKNTCKTGRNLAVDHNHSTKKARQLLCIDCNRAIGVFELLDPDAKQRFIDYLPANP